MLLLVLLLCIVIAGVVVDSLPLGLNDWSILQYGGELDPTAVREPAKSGDNGLLVTIHRSDRNGQQLGLVKRLIHNKPINYWWGSGVVLDSGLRDNVLLDFRGYIKVPQTGLYQFRTQSDDGVKLSVDDKTIIDQWKVQAATFSESQSVMLDTSRYYHFNLRWYEHGGDATLRLFWRTPDFKEWTVVPHNVFVQQPPVTKTAMKSTTPLTQTPLKRTDTKYPPQIPPPHPRPRPKFTHQQLQPKPLHAPQSLPLPTLQTDEQQVMKVEKDTVNLQKVVPKFQGSLQSLRKDIGTGHVDMDAIQKINQKMGDMEKYINRKLSELKQQQQKLSLKLVKLGENHEHTDKMKTLSRVHGTERQTANLSATQDSMAFAKGILSGHEQRLHSVEMRLLSIRGGLVEIKMLLKELNDKLQHGYRCQITGDVRRRETEEH